MERQKQKQLQTWETRSIIHFDLKMQIHPVISKQKVSNFGWKPTFMEKSASNMLNEVKDFIHQIS